MIMFMSVFTHLKPHEIKMYLAEAARVVKPGGMLIASFLDANNPKHRDQFQTAPVRWLARVLARTVRLTFTSPETLSDWVESADFRVEQIIDYEDGRQHTLIARR
jgi:ubiquinone/menaquinone biosynthesis C-methylase UbiE